MTQFGYRLAPSQLQASRRTEPWLQVTVPLAAGQRVEDALATARAMTDEHEAMRTSLRVLEGMRLPVQVVDDRRPSVAQAMDDAAAADIAAVSACRRAAVTTRAGWAVDVLPGQPARVVVTAHASVADAASVQRVGQAVARGGPLAGGTQFPDFSEWLADGIEEVEGATRAFWQERAALPALAVPPTAGGPTGRARADVTLTAGEGWAETVLDAWSAVLFERCGRPDRCRIDRVLSYRVCGDLDDVVGPMTVLVPTLVDRSVGDTGQQLRQERAACEDRLDGFDLPFESDDPPVAVFDAQDTDVREGSRGAVLDLRVRRTGAGLCLTLVHALDAVPADYAELLVEALARRLGGRAAPGPIERAWQRRHGEPPPGPHAREDPLGRLRDVVVAAPGTDAIVCGARTWSRQQLWDECAAVAALLQRQGVGAGDRVGLLADRSPEAIAGLFGILWVGAVFVPLNPSDPTERLRALIRDARPSLVLATRTDAAGHALEPVPTFLDALQPGTPAPPAAVPAAAPAYLLYTSGSTGRPKGVIVARHGLTRLLDALQPSVGGSTATGRRVAVNAPLAFDAAIKQLVLLLRGDVLWLVDAALRLAPTRLLGALRREGVHLLDCTPSQLRLLLEASAHAGTGLPAVVLVGGEAITPDLWAALAATSSSCVNVYGPTEATVVSTAAPVDAALAPSIGTPLPGVQISVRDPRGRVAPAGAVGEAWIGGDRLAAGYWDRPTETAAAFTEDADGRWYRSGDLVRWRPDGLLEFHGRRDQQVKLRGHRVELAEVECALAAHPQVRRSVAVVRSVGDELELAVLTEVRGRTAPTAAALRPGGRELQEQNRLETAYLFEEIFQREVYAAHGVVLPPGAVVLDVGANIGVFSLWIRHRWPDARIHAFEPVPATADCLQANVAGLPGVHVHRYALGADAGTVDLLHYPRYSMMSGLAALSDPAGERAVIAQQLRNEIRAGRTERAALLDHIDELLQGRFEGELVQVPSRPLGAVLRELAVDRVDLLKVDVQRAERDVLLGLGDGLAKVNQLVVEVHDAPGTPTHGRLDELCDLLEGHGFELAVDQDPMLQGTDRFVVSAWRRAWRQRVTDSGHVAAPGELALRSWLEDRLPAAMLPHRLRVVEELPLGPTGKIDRLAAAEIAFTEPSDPREATAELPTTPTEERLASVWSKVLGRDHVGVGESFFDLGGDSIRAIRAQVAAAAEGLHFDLQALFQHSTVRELAAHTRATGNGARARTAPFELISPELRAALPADLGDAYPMGGLQAGMLYHALSTGDPRTYRNVSTVRLRAPYDPAALRAAWRETVAGHEILRTALHIAEPEGLLQWVHRHVETVIGAHDLRDRPSHEALDALAVLARAQLTAPLDLTVPPLVRIGLAGLPDGEVALILSEHHAVLDGLSLELLVQELLARYEAALHGTRLPSSRLRCGPSDFIRAELAAVAPDLPGWRRVLAGAQPLRCATPQPAGETRTYVHRSWTVPPALCAAAARRAQALGAQLKHLLLAAHAVSLGRWCGVDDVVTGLVVHGRPSRPDGDLMLGLFIHALPVRLTVRGPTWAQLIAAAADEDRRLQESRHVPLAHIRSVVGPAAAVPTFLNVTAFTRSDGPFPELGRRPIGVDVDVDLAVDVALADGVMVLSHQFARGALTDDASTQLARMTLEALRAAGDPGDDRPVDMPAGALPRHEGGSPAPAPPEDHRLAETVAVLRDLFGTDPALARSFRELGGDSLTALVAAHRLARRTGQRVCAGDVLRARDVAAIAALLRTPVRQP